MIDGINIESKCKVFFRDLVLNSLVCPDQREVYFKRRIELPEVRDSVKDSVKDSAKETTTKAVESVVAASTEKVEAIKGSGVFDFTAPCPNECDPNSPLNGPN